VPSPVSRNAPCPCGSGKRYKECHGLLAAPEEATVAAGAELRQALEAALEAQVAERFAEAIVIYEQVAAAQPDNFDALHMLGVVHYQRGDLEQARARVRAAIRLRPFDRAARTNFELIELALERRTIEQDICREVLPRLALRCVAPNSSVEQYGRQDADLDIIILKADMDARWSELARVMRWFRSQAITVWAEYALPASQRDVTLRTIDLNAGEVPRADHVAFFGADRAPGDWFAAMPATASTALYCSDEPHCLLVDRIPELAREGIGPLRLLFSSAAHARRIGLPGTIVADEGGDISSRRTR